MEKEFRRTNPDSLTPSPPFPLSSLTPLPLTMFLTFGLNYDINSRKSIITINKLTDRQKDYQIDRQTDNQTSQDKTHIQRFVFNHFISNQDSELQQYKKLLRLNISFCKQPDTFFCKSQPRLYPFRKYKTAHLPHLYLSSWAESEILWSSMLCIKQLLSNSEP